MIDDYIYVMLALIIFFFTITFTLFCYYRQKILNLINDIEQPVKIGPVCPCPTPITNPVNQNTIEANLNP